jgi:hypothetical protein
MEGAKVESAAQLIPGQLRPAQTTLVTPDAEVAGLALGAGGWLGSGTVGTLEERTTPVAAPLTAAELTLLAPLLTCDATEVPTPVALDCAPEAGNELDAGAAEGAADASMGWTEDWATCGSLFLLTETLSPESAGEQAVSRQMTEQERVCIFMVNRAGTRS